MADFSLAGKIAAYMLHPEFKQTLIQATREWLDTKGLPHDTKLTSELKKEWSEYVADYTIKKAKEVYPDGMGK